MEVIDLSESEEDPELERDIERIQREHGLPPFETSLCTDPHLFQLTLENPELSMSDFLSLVRALARSETCRRALANAGIDFETATWEAFGRRRWAFQPWVLVLHEYLNRPPVTTVPRRGPKATFVRGLWTAQGQSLLNGVVRGLALSLYAEYLDDPTADNPGWRTDLADERDAILPWGGGVPHPRMNLEEAVERIEADVRARGNFYFVLFSSPQEIGSSGAWARSPLGSQHAVPIRAMMRDADLALHYPDPRRDWEAPIWAYAMREFGFKDRFSDLLATSIRPHADLTTTAIRSVGVRRMAAFVERSFFEDWDGAIFDPRGDKRRSLKLVELVDPVAAIHLTEERAWRDFLDAPEPEEPEEGAGPYDRYWPFSYIVNLADEDSDRLFADPERWLRQSHAEP